MFCDTVDGNGNIEPSEYEIKDFDPYPKAGTVEIIKDKKQFYKDNENSLDAIQLTPKLTIRSAIAESDIASHLF